MLTPLLSGCGYYPQQVGLGNANVANAYYFRVSSVGVVWTQQGN